MTQKSKTFPSPEVCLNITSKFFSLSPISENNNKNELQLSVKELKRKYMKK